jgi:hypothetical protein
MLADELMTYLFDGRAHLLSKEVRMWLASSRRFTAFVTTFRDKIRKKLRVTQDQETLQDLRLELETAYLLLQERSLSMAYESDQSGHGRSPDFAVSFTTSMTFMVEVTRLRGATKGTMPSSNNGILSEDERIMDVICSKLGQLLPQRSNILIVGVDIPPLKQGDLQALMLRLQKRAEAKDSTLWQRYGFRDRADFFRHYQWLSEVFVRRSELQDDEVMTIWVNPQAKYPLPSKVRTTLYRSHHMRNT